MSTSHARYIRSVWFTINQAVAENTKHIDYGYFSFLASSFGTILQLRLYQTTSHLLYCMICSLLLTDFLDMLVNAIGSLSSGAAETPDIRPRPTQPAQSCCFREFNLSNNKHPGDEVRSKSNFVLKMHKNRPISVSYGTYSVREWQRKQSRSSVPGTGWSQEN